MNPEMVVHRSIVIAENPERIWRAITTPEEISKWFDGHMQWEFELAAGAKITFRYDGAIIGYGSIVTVEPPECFAFHWTPEPGNPVESLVTFVLENILEGTNVTISEEGFEALPEDVGARRFDMNNQGWEIALNHLSAYLQAEDHAGT